MARPNHRSGPKISILAGGIPDSKSEDNFLKMQHRMRIQSRGKRGKIGGGADVRGEGEIKAEFSVRNAKVTWLVKAYKSIII